MWLNQSDKEIEDKWYKVSLVFQEWIINQLNEYILLSWSSFRMSSICRIHFRIKIRHTTLKELQRRL